MDKMLSSSKKNTMQLILREKLNEILRKRDDLTSAMKFLDQNLTKVKDKVNDPDITQCSTSEVLRLAVYMDLFSEKMSLSEQAIDCLDDLKVDSSSQFLVDAKLKTMESHSASASLFQNQLEDMQKQVYSLQEKQKISTDRIELAEKNIDLIKVEQKSNQDNITKMGIKQLLLDQIQLRDDKSILKIDERISTLEDSVQAIRGEVSGLQDEMKKVKTLKKLLNQLQQNVDSRVETSTKLYELQSEVARLHSLMSSIENTQYKESADSVPAFVAETVVNKNPYKLGDKLKFPKVRYNNRNHFTNLHPGCRGW
ncbi:uncharacterized protein LOC131955328 [Physella acuta]|uniref:uncharacterized protein LOC131955328 n=1 Tax=Physella acuta TaxID=109671 RepID=UPI0027DC3185|nr:uncharacterized protein LOC131955328 [Physella acuta]